MNTKPASAAVLDQLATAFEVIRNASPLAIGIHKEIRRRLPDIADAELRQALRRHTTSTKYLKAVANGTARFDLDKQPAGEVTAEQRQLALDSLKERFRKAAERQREAQQEKERQEKLQKLAEKFGRK